MPHTKLLLASLLSALLASTPAAGECNADECYAIPCAREGEFCTECTVCPEGTECRDGVCRQDAAGDICSWACSSLDPETGANTLFCNYSRCAPLPALGEPCIYNAHPCMPGLYCTATDASLVGVCRPNPALGEPCSRADGSVCPAGAYCAGDPEGVCTLLPSAGEPCYQRACLPPYVCEFNASDESDGGKCREVPAAAGMKCSEAYGCGGGSLYCEVEHGAEQEVFSGTCAQLPGLEDSCKVALGCAEGLVCVPAEGDLDNCTCKKRIGMKGDYCDDVRSFCNDTFACISNECADRIRIGDECSKDSECTGYPSSFCLNGVCSRAMSVKEGSPCYPKGKINGTISISSVYASVQCADGLGCVPDERSVSGYSCTKIATRVEDRIKCDYGEINVCPRDSFCTCNDRDGVTQCIPYVPSSKWLLERHGAIVLAKDDAEAAHDAYVDVVGRFLKHKVYYRCGSWEKDTFGSVKKSAAAGAVAPSMLSVVLGTVLACVLVLM